jgi:hypothetical protein
MGDLGEFGEGFFADVLGGGIGGAKLRVLGFEIDEFAIKGVVFLVGDGGSGFLVITAVMLLDDPAEMGGAGLGGGRHGKIRSSKLEIRF